MSDHPSNLPASIHQRLLNQAKKKGRPLQELLQYFAIERFLFRLSQSPHATRFYLKGGTHASALGCTPVASDDQCRSDGAADVVPG